MLTNVGSLPPALREALAAFDAGIATDATAVLGMILRDRMEDSDERAWTSSPLTGSGFPVEITFTTADDRLRYTVEPASWRDSPQHRLDVAARIVEQLAGQAVPRHDLRAWRRAQRHGDARYGAWIGGRHGAGGDTRYPPENEFKLYVETDKLDEVGIRAALGSGPRVPDRATTLRMVAYSPVTRRYETYYRVQSLTPWHLPRVLAPAGLESRSDELLEYLTDAYGYAFRDRLPGSSVGVSYSIEAGAEPQSVTLFFFARVFWGGDAHIRERFGSLTRAMGWDDSRYQTVTAALASRHACTTHHGILGFTLLRNGRLHLSIGVRPPNPLGETGTEPGP